MKRISAILVSIVLALLCAVPAFAEETTAADDYYSYSLPSEWKADDFMPESSDLILQKTWSKGEHHMLFFGIEDNEYHLNMSKLSDTLKDMYVERIIKSIDGEISDSNVKINVGDHSSKMIQCNGYDALQIDIDLDYDLGGMTVDAKAHAYAFASKAHVFTWEFMTIHEADMTEAERLEILNTFKINESMPGDSIFSSNNDSDSTDSGSSDLDPAVIVISTIAFLGIIGLVVFFIVKNSKSNNPTVPMDGIPQGPYNTFNQTNNGQQMYNQNQQYGQQMYNQNQQYNQQMYNQNPQYGQQMNNQNPQYGQQINNQNPQYGQQMYNQNRPTNGYPDPGNQPTTYVDPNNQK